MLVLPAVPRKAANSLLYFDLCVYAVDLLCGVFNQTFIHSLLMGTKHHPEEFNAAPAF